MEILADQETQCRLKTGETESGQKKDNNQQANFGLPKRVNPLGEPRPGRHMIGSRLPAFGQNRKCQAEIDGAQSGSDPTRAGWTKAAKNKPANRESANAHSANRGTENES